MHSLLSRSEEIPSGPLWILVVSEYVGDQTKRHSLRFVHLCRWLIDCCGIPMEEGHSEPFHELGAVM